MAFKITDKDETFQKKKKKKKLFGKKLFYILKMKNLTQKITILMQINKIKIKQM